MGAETELLVKVGEATLNVVTHGRAELGPGQKILLNPQARNAHLFDCATSLRI